MGINDFSSVEALPDSGATASGILALGAGVLIFLGILLFVLLAVALVFYIFQAIGISKMMKSLKLNNSWMAFVPYLNIFAFGKVAEQYIKKDGSKSAKYSVILTVLYLGSLLLSIPSGFLSALLEITGSNENTVLVIAGISLILSLIQLAVIIPYTVIFYFALWRIFAIFESKSATLYTVLSIFLPVQPFLIFAVRNRKPQNVELPQEEAYFYNEV